jgi:DNA polymerase-3 subunit beta
VETETVTIAHNNLNAAVKAVAGFMPRRSQKPILRNLRLRATADSSFTAAGLEVYATDLETCAVISLGDTDGETIATTLVPADTAAAIGKAKEAVSIVPNETTIETLGARVPVEDALEYPEPPETFDGAYAAWLPFAFVRAVDDAVSCATDNESSRYALGGILLERIDGDRLVRAVGTDGRRLHAITVDDGGTDKGPLSAIVYPHAIRLFRKAVQGMAAAIVGKAGKAAAAYCDGASVGVRVNGDDVELSWGVAGCRVRVVTRTIQGRFPRWRDVFPLEVFEPSPVMIPMPAGREQIVAAARCQSEMSKGVQFTGAPLYESGAEGDGPATLSARSSDRGEYSAPFVGTMPAGVKIKLDPAFLVEMIDGAAAVADCKAVPMYVRDHLSGAAVSVNGGIDPRGGIGFAAILMPLAAD